MEPLIIDVDNELRFISREIDILKRKRQRKVIQLAEHAVRSLELFKRDWTTFKGLLLSKEDAWRS